MIKGKLEMKKIILFFIIISIYGVNASDTFYDRKTGLEWSNKTIPYLEVKAAIQYCNNLVLDSKDDWYLPSIKELFTLVNFKVKPPIQNAFWSSSPFEYGIYMKDYRKDEYWHITKDGLIIPLRPFASRSVKCARRAK